MPHTPRPASLTACPDDETIAAYIDGTLPGIARADVLLHMAECARCRELAAETVTWIAADELHADQAVHQQHDHAVAQTPPPSSSRSGLRRAMAIGVGTLATAATVFLVLQIDQTRRGALVDSEGEAAAIPFAAAHDTRTVQARLSGVRYSPVVPLTRSQAAVEQLVIHARATEEQAAQSPTAENLHAWGIAQLLLGELDGAVETLERARTNALAEDPRLLNDLAVAYFERGHAVDREADLRMALSLAQRAIEEAPDRAEPWFNRALILERTASPETARAAWQDLIARDDTPWRDEAEARLRALASQDPPSQPRP
jgi:tetratricopeptide (TPR) repeat protein